MNFNTSSITTIFIKGHKRSVKAKKNIIASLFLKGSSILIGFLLVRASLEYLDQTHYGIWITISSFLTWFTFFDLGLGQGLRNRLAEAFAKNDLEKAKIYISTTYGIITIFTLFIFVAFLGINNILDWTIILNTDKDLFNELRTLTLVVFGFFFLRFVLNLVGIILIADQLPAVNNLFGPLGNLFSLIAIYILINFGDGSLLSVGIVMSVFPVIILIIATIYFFFGKYRSIAPSISCFRYEYIGDLFGLGMKFFLIQISGLVLFQSGNIIIAHFYGPAEVVPYNISYQYFSIISMVFSILLTPFWSAATEAWVKEDIEWIKRSVRKLKFLWFILVGIAVLMVIFAKYFFVFWLGIDKVENMNISLSLLVLFALQFLLYNFGGIFNMFINGISKIKLQLLSRGISAILFIPLTFLFSQVLNWGISGIVLATIVADFYSILIAPIQFNKLINKRAKGIWNK